VEVLLSNSHPPLNEHVTVTSASLFGVQKARSQSESGTKGQFLSEFLTVASLLSWESLSFWPPHGHWAAFNGQLIAGTRLKKQTINQKIAKKKNWESGKKKLSNYNKTLPKKQFKKAEREAVCIFVFSFLVSCAVDFCGLTFKWFYVDFYGKDRSYAENLYTCELGRPRTRPRTRRDVNFNDANNYRGNFESENYNGNSFVSVYEYSRPFFIILALHNVT